MKQSDFFSGLFELACDVAEVPFEGFGASEHGFFPKTGAEGLDIIYLVFQVGKSVLSGVGPGAVWWVLG